MLWLMKETFLIKEHMIPFNDYTSGCLLDYVYFKNYHETIAIDLSKQQALDPTLKSVKQILLFFNFTEILNRVGRTSMYFIVKKAKETVLDFSQGTVKILWIYVALIKYQYKMTQYKALNLKLSNSQLNKLKSPIKNDIQL